METVVINKIPSEETPLVLAAYLIIDKDQLDDGSPIFQDLAFALLFSYTSQLCFFGASNVDTMDLEMLTPM